jgi:hypothetical protein
MKDLFPKPDWQRHYGRFAFDHFRWIGIFEDVSELYGEETSILPI